MGKCKLSPFGEQSDIGRNSRVQLVDYQEALMEHAQGRPVMEARCE